MEKPSLDRESLFFTQACHLERGIQFVAEFQADKVSNPDEGPRYYAVTLTIDPVTQRPHNNGIWELTEGHYYSGPKDRLRVLEYQLRDQFIKLPAWEILSKRKPDPNYTVDELGEVVEPPPRITRHI